MTKTWARCTLTAELLSDAHPGSGSGGGGVDALIARDRYNRPVIWASRVEGVLRDAARRLRGDAAAEAFFGRAGGDKASGDRQRAAFTSLYVKESVGSRIWRSTARAAFDNRAPKDDTLRVVEYAPKGAQFVGEVELPECDFPTLQRLVMEVDALGSGRAAGAGRVKLSLARTTPAPRALGTPTGRLLLLLRNLDPLCITATATPDNLIPSLAFVPGRALLGALAAWLIAEGDCDEASLLTSGKVSVSDALPLPPSPDQSQLASIEVLPAPLTLQSEKPKGYAGDTPWWAQAKTPTQRLDAWGAAEKLKRPEDDLFVYRTGSNSPWVTFRPARRARLRNGRTDPKQPSPSLFAIEQIVEETCFLAELRSSPENMRCLAQKLAPILEGRRWLRVGRAGAPVEVARGVWAADAAPVAVSGERALLILTSDLLVCDEFLRWRVALDEAALQSLLGVKDIQLGRSLQDSVMIHGFNGTARLWRMPAAAIRRGSVFEVSGAGVASLAARAAAGQWLGERAHEGFGRFRLDAGLPGATPAPTADALALAAGDSEESVAAKTQEWLNKLLSLANPGSGADRKPSLSQWFDLVADLERGDAKALDGRLNPTTAGARAWKHKDAKEILEKLNAVPKPQQKLYARYFARRPRAAMRKEV